MNISDYSEDALDQLWDIVDSYDAKPVKVTHERTARSVSFVAEGKLTEEQATEEQTKLGYNPAGYGFFGFVSVRLSSGKERTSWQCWNNCD